VKFFGFFENPTAPPWCRNNIFLAMEYFPLGDLYRVLCAPDSQPSTEEDARYIASQLLYCLQIMHGLGITHRDLKPQARVEGKMPESTCFTNALFRMSSWFSDILSGG
jgi:serine/threonine protein kinase